MSKFHLGYLISLLRQAFEPRLLLVVRSTLSYTASRSGCSKACLSKEIKSPRWNFLHYKKTKKHFIWWLIQSFYINVKKCIPKPISIKTIFFLPAMPAIQGSTFKMTLRNVTLPLLSHTCMQYQQCISFFQKKGMIIVKW